MFSRRFINVVMKDFRAGGSYWLYRMMPQEKLFYPSAAEAIAQTMETRKMSLPFGSTLELTPSVARFKSSREACLTLDFMPFYGLRRGEGKIVAVDSAGQTVMYDADDGSIEMLPRLNAPHWQSPISLCANKANASGAQESSRSNALYAINSSHSSEFRALVHYDPYGFGRSDEKKAWHWLHLPPPPYLDHPACEDHTIQSYTLLEDGKTICFSSVPDKGGFGTYCFDTSNHQWAKAGGWVLPFHGRALQVPELHGLWFGIGDNQHELRAVDLSSLDRAPKVLHRWRCSDPPNHWLLIGSSMVYLGANRFCIARTFGAYTAPRKYFEQLTDTAAILTGVEIVNAEANKTKLRMVEHKSRTYIFERCGIESVF
ncbi:unnamed protein product [Alopecurus aequalis]